MEDILWRFWSDLSSRPSGPLNLRFFLQPAMAILFGIRAGMRDGRDGLPPYFSSLISNTADRRNLLRDGWKDIGKLFLMACLLDAVFQLITMRWIYPIETLIIACVLAVLPYLLARGITDRISSVLKR
jgi:hypothetical protein